MDSAGGWVSKLIDVKEAKDQIVFALPLILTNAAYYLIPVVSVMFAGHLGELELAGSNLANSWAAVTGFSLMVGLSGGLETLCGQGFGAQMYRMLGVHLQASCIISIIFAIFISVLWWFSNSILILLHQDSQIANSAALYLKYLIPGLFANALLQNMLRFLQTQSVVMPLMLCSLIPLTLHVPLAYAFLNFTSLGFVGPPLAASISLWLSFFMLCVYVLKAKKFAKTWEGFSLEFCGHIFTNLKLALPSAAMGCLEFWAFEILVLLAGLMPNSKISTSIIAMCVNTEGIAFMIAYGLSAAASTRVANELGAGYPDRARHASGVTLKLTVLLAVLVVVALSFGHNLWARAFSHDTVIISAFASMTPFLVASIICDFFQAILSGVARGCGWQRLAMIVNLGAYYLIGMSVAVLLGFKFKLHVKGLWIGLICGIATQAVGLLLLTMFTKWTKMELSQHSSSNITEANVINEHPSSV